MKKNVFLLLFLLLYILPGCGPTKLIRTIRDESSVNTLKIPNNYLRIHTKDGGLYLLKEWKFQDSLQTMTGYGEYYDHNRNLLKGKWMSPDDGKINFPLCTIPADEIALIETTSVLNKAGNLAGLSIVCAASVITAIYCIINPKACFGSCPTFSVLENNKWTLMSEGFSSSISPALEKKDIDMLYNTDEKKNEISLKLTNEALETHVIRYADLLAFPETDGEKIFATEDGRFYRTAGMLQPSRCGAEEGSCLDLVKEMDHKERFSGADPKNLAEKEDIIVNFSNVPPSEVGFVIGSKQTLLTTYLFYQGMAFSGNYYGSLFASMENGNRFLSKGIQRLFDKLGGIEIFITDKNNKWLKIDEIKEMGPIATDVHLVKLPSTATGNLTVKLRMTKGLWRIDYLGLARISGEEIPVRIKPDLVLKNDTCDTDALKKLTQSANPLITFPGDSYLLKYKLPVDCDQQLFLETKGYYLEWMREDWLKEENIGKVAVAFNFPGLFMRRAAPEFKKAEPEMEKIFWESRYVRY